MPRTTRLASNTRCSYPLCEHFQDPKSSQNREIFYQQVQSHLILITKALQPVCPHLSFALDGDDATTQQLGVGRLVHENTGSDVGEMNFVHLRVALHAAGSVHRVTKQAESRVHVAHHGGYHWPAVEPHANVDVA